MKPILLKKKAKFVKGETYSICLRGARRFERDEFDLSLYNPGDDNPSALANIESQSHFKFDDLSNDDCIDNYDREVKGIARLHAAMKDVYPSFDPREIVTILRFTVV
jgi:hypothetical protein